MFSPTSRRLLFSCLLVVVPALAYGQKQKPAAKPGAKKKKEIVLPKIADTPVTVDPATLIPRKLAAKATISFTDTSLKLIAKWIQDTQKITVLFDDAALSKAGIPQSELVTDHLKDEPVYFLLNRLRSLGLAWYVEDDILHVTTTSVAADRMSTKPYNIGDLLDAKFKRDDLNEAILAGTSGPWNEGDGEGGSMQWLGDVLFVRHTDDIQREVQGLLTALRKHGRRTFTFDPPQHGLLRERLEKNASIRVQATPLVRAIEELARNTGADIRLDVPGLREARVRDREPVTLTLPNRELKTVLNVLLADLKLTWILRDGVLWITSVERAAEFKKTAVFDVRDLCRNGNESAALSVAIQSQTSGPWLESEGSGGRIAFPRAGAMVIRHTEKGLGEVSTLLATYRKALLASKQRDRDVVDPKEVITRYYRMNDKIATDLVKLLPQLVQPESWQSALRQKAPGTILKASSQPEVLAANGKRVRTSSGDSGQVQAILARAVLIVRQSRAAHDEIATLIGRVERGDPSQKKGGGAGGYGGGGFGGGFFSIPESKRAGAPRRK